MGDADYAEIFNRILVPVCDEFRPEFIIVSAGFDAHKYDPLGGMGLTETGFGRMTKILIGIAKKYANNRLLLALEGGYHLEALMDSVKEVLEVLQGKEPESTSEEPSHRALEIIDRVIKFNKRYWKEL